MLVIGLAMAVIVAAAGQVVAYVAYPQRGRAMPRVPWVGDAMTSVAVKVGIHDEPTASDQRATADVDR